MTKPALATVGCFALMLPLLASADRSVAIAAGSDGVSVLLPPDARPKGQKPGLAPGLWEIVLSSATLNPSMALDEQSFSVCYTEKDAQTHVNPVIPPEAAKNCSKNFMAIGGDIVFTASCKEAFQSLRVSYINADLYRGSYTFSTSLNVRPKVMLAPAVEMRRVTEKCP